MNGDPGPRRAPTVPSDDPGPRLAPTVAAGYFGFGNAGDELILQSLVKSVRGASWTALVPRRVSVPGAGVADRWSFRAVTRALRGARVLVFGGGEIFQARTSWRSLTYYLGLLLWARLLGCRVLVYGIGLDPGLPAWARRLTTAALAVATKVWARDATTAEHFGASVVADAAWTWPVEAPRPPEYPSGILWILRLTGPEDVADWAAALNALGASGGEHGFLPLQPSLDLPDLGRLRLKLDFPHRLESWTALDDVFRAVGRYGAVITMRYHGLVAAALAGRRCAAMADHGKVLELARSLSVSVLRRSDLSGPALAALTAHALSSVPPDPAPWRARAEQGLRELEAALAK